MSPYEVRLLIEIDVGLYPLTHKKTPLLANTIGDFAHRGLIDIVEANTGRLNRWKTTKLGRAVCNRLYAVNESGIKFCGKCGQVVCE